MIPADMMNVIELDEARDKLEKFDKLKKTVKAFTKYMDEGGIMRILGSGMSNDEGEVDKLEELFDAMKKAERAAK